uniref:Uncharacterized protein n=1 Tax=Lotus japonicus TaxID=34305 RepID=I3S2Y8_LOTJA|nr:unknown [Lotus japonicus]
MDHTLHPTSRSYINRSRTSTFSYGNKKSSPYVGFS